MASAVRSESLSSYLRQIGGRPQLTREQEYELARRARKGDTTARDTLAHARSVAACELACSQASAYARKLARERYFTRSNATPSNPRRPSGLCA